MGHYAGFSHSVERVSPSQAHEWLASQFGGQRSLREHHVSTLALEMQRGSFIPHSAIVLGVLQNREYLLDGQHRLKAITVFDQDVTMPVLRRSVGSEAELRQLYGNIDQGLRRSARDAIRAQGLDQELGLSQRQAGRISGAVKHIAAGFLDGTGGSSATARQRTAAVRSNAAVTELLREWAPEARMYFDFISAGETSTKYLFERGAVIACGLVSIRSDAQRAEEFWRSAAEDDGLSRHDPRKRFVVWLRDNKERASNVARAFNKAWLAFHEGREIKTFRIETSAPVAIYGADLDQFAFHV